MGVFHWVAHCFVLLDHAKNLTKHKVLCVAIKTCLYNFCFGTSFNQMVSLFALNKSEFEKLTASALESQAPDVQIGVILGYSNPSTFVRTCFLSKYKSSHFYDELLVPSFNLYLKRKIFKRTSERKPSIEGPADVIEGKTFFRDDWPAVSASLSGLLYLHRISHECSPLSPAAVGWVPVAS